MNILTFDIEDWFHILDHNSTKTHNEWNNFECRLHRNTDRIIELLNNNNIKATFFCLGWIAEKYPEIIRTLDSMGFEIAAHSHMHQLLYHQSITEFRRDTEQSIKLLEDITGKKITVYRAPGFSVKQNTLWALEVLVENGIEIDCSVFPAYHGHGGFSAFKHSSPCIIEYNGIKIKEFPLNTYKFFSKNVVFTGGGYFRLLPYSIIKHFSSASDYMMAYFHPRDFDYMQPVIKDLAPYRKFKSYYGLKYSMVKLEKWINDFPFIDIRSADNMIKWNNMKIIKL
jgi:peptidoglycan-N-acetylglucosamine deacetylase